MKRIYIEQYQRSNLSSFLFALCSLLFTSCSQEEPLPQETTVLQFIVSDFPAFGESPKTRAIGTPDAGKTTWEKDDEILVTLISQRYGEQNAAITYDGSKWNLNGSLSYLENEIPVFGAIYAPCYEVAEVGLIQLKSGMLLGMTEHLDPSDCQVENSTISISFEDVTRDYSRLRIVGMAGETYTVTTTGFTPAGATSEATEPYTLTADEKGNAYLYGTFAKDATVTVKQDGTEVRSYTFTTETEHGKSYALDVRPVIDGTSTEY